MTTTVTTGAPRQRQPRRDGDHRPRSQRAPATPPQQEVDTTNADGSTSVSISDLTRNGTLIEQDRFQVSADGLTRTVTTDSTGDGVNDLTETDATVINGDGSRTETVTDTNSDGSMRDQTVTVTSANGLNSTTSRDSAGNGVFNLDHHHRHREQCRWQHHDHQTDYANNGTMLDQTVTTVSADGLTTTTQTDSTGNGVFDQTQSGRHRGRCLGQPHRDHHRGQRQWHGLRASRSSSITPMA